MEKQSIEQSERDPSGKGKVDEGRGRVGPEAGKILREKDEPQELFLRRVFTHFAGDGLMNERELRRAVFSMGLGLEDRLCEKRCT